MNFDELWPLPYPGVVVVTGGYGVGKSTFALSTGAAMERTLVVDFETSQRAFAKQLGFDVNIGIKSHQNRGIKCPLFRE